GLTALELAGRLTAEGMEQGPLNVALAMEMAAEAVLIRELLLTQPTHDGRLRAEGRIALEEDVAADLSIHWERLAWPLQGAPMVESPRGEARFTGPLDDYRLSVTADLVSPEQP